MQCLRSKSRLLFDVTTKRSSWPASLGASDQRSVSLALNGARRTFTTQKARSFRIASIYRPAPGRFITTTTTGLRMASETPGTQKNQRPQSEAIPYKGPPLPNVAEDLIVPGILPTPLPAFSKDEDEERLWVPQSPDISFRPLIFSVSQGYFVNLLRVRRSGILSRHRHTGPVHAVTLKGRWHYLEHSWWANEGGYSYEPSGDIHTLEVPEGVEEMITLFHVTGAYVYVDPEGNSLGIEDVFSKLQSAKEHYERVGLGAAYAEQFIR